MKSEGYSIKDLEVLSGVKMHTIRIWEKRYKLLEPSRTDTNIRFYNDNDLRRILNISLLVNNKFKISKVAKWNEEQIRNAVLDVSQKKTADSDIIEQLIRLMLSFDISGFYGKVSETIEKLGFEYAFSKVFFGLFERIGSYWMVGSVFPAQEHLVTNIFRQKLISETDKLGFENSRKATILFFLHEDELHEMSLLYYAYLARKSGYNVLYLGQKVPFEDLTKIQGHIAIDFVFTAFINPLIQEELETYMFNLKEVFPNQRIFVTGLQIQHYEGKFPRLFKPLKDQNEFIKYLG